MCGIAGSFGRGVPGGNFDVQAKNILAHRGPDDHGEWHDDVASLLHWRLAVIDLSPAGHQPMVSHGSRYVLSYNGEVYNFQELRADVEREWQRVAATRDVADLPRWRGHSDTEVVLEGFALWGEEFLGRLNGMFALALYDRQARRLYLARDRAGIKPLYFWQRGDALLFSSEPKFFFFARAFTPAIDARGLSAFFTYGHCYGANHALAGVRKLDPGEVLCCGAPVNPAVVAGTVTVRSSRLCTLPVWRPVLRRDRDAATELRARLERAVARQLVADVPIGVLLSGGVDSSILTALTAQSMGAKRTMAFTLGYPGTGRDYDEVQFAGRVARHLGVEHHVYEATEQNLIDDLERIVWHFDEPFADAAALNVYVLSRMIRSRVTVALAGEGSDELFGGYRRYALEKYVRGLGPIGRGLCHIARKARLQQVGWMPRRLHVALRALARSTADARYSSYLQNDTPLEAILKPEWCRAIGTHPIIRDGYRDDLPGGTVSRLCLVDQQFWLPGTYLEKSDKGSMAHALEVRVPFLDNDVVEFANTLPDAQRIRRGSRKWLLGKAFGDLLPAEVFSRFKRGFGVPVARWLRRELRGYYTDLVLAPSARVKTYLQMPTVEACFREHVRGVSDHSLLLWQCLVLEIWLRHYEQGFRIGPAASARSTSAPPVRRRGSP